MLGAGRPRPAGWSLRQQQQHQQQMKQQSMDVRAYCGKHALIGRMRSGRLLLLLLLIHDGNDTDANSS